MVKIALIGLGAVSEFYYAPALNELERLGVAHVSACFDPRHEQIRSLKERFPSCFGLKSVGELIPSIADLAIVASPNCFHAEQTIELLTAGISVLTEKPMAATVDQALAMLERSRLSGKLLSVGHFRRFYPACQSIGEIVASGLLGKVMGFQFFEGAPFAWPLQSASLFDKRTASGGVLIDIGSHVLDLVIYWFGEPDEIQYSDDAMGGVEANCLIELGFPTGCTGKVRLSRVCLLDNQCVIEFEKGVIVWNVHQSSQIEVVLKDAGFALSAQIHNLIGSRNSAACGVRHEQSFRSAPARSEPPLTRSAPARSEPPLTRSAPAPGVASRLEPPLIITRQILNVVRAIEGKELLRSPGEEAIRSLKLIEHCYESRSLMEMAWLTDSERVRSLQYSSKSNPCKSASICLEEVPH